MSGPSMQHRFQGSVEDHSKFVVEIGAEAVAANCLTLLGARYAFHPHRNGTKFDPARLPTEELDATNATRLNKATPPPQHSRFDYITGSEERSNRVRFQLVAFHSFATESLLIRSIFNVSGLRHAMQYVQKRRRDL